MLCSEGYRCGGLSEALPNTTPTSSSNEVLQHENNGLRDTLTAKK
jgi:hypothetical protein